MENQQESSRRKFLKTFATTAAAVGVGSNLFAAKAKNKQVIKVKYLRCIARWLVDREDAEKLTSMPTLTYRRANAALPASRNWPNWATFRL